MTEIDTILLDRDGTLILEEHYLRDPNRVRLIPGVTAPMRRLSQLGSRFIIVSNQSGIGRGLITLDEYHTVHSRLEGLLRAEGISLHATAFCPHSPDAGCDCRKPLTGLWKALTREHDLHPENSVMIGDKIADIHFGQAIGCRQTVLVQTGHGLKEAEKIGLPSLDGSDIAFMDRPQWPSAYVKNLGTYLELLVQKKEHVHARRL